MAQTHEIRIPDLGGADDVEVIEVLVEQGQDVELEQPLMTLESDKASMDVPTNMSGRITKLHIKVGDQVNEGDLIAELEAEVGAATPEKQEPAEQKPTHANSAEKVASANEKSTSADVSSNASSNASNNASNSVVVIGSGPGGYTAAFRAADLGLEVTLIERYAALGGVCLNVGCIPSKALLHSASVITEAKSMSAHGVTFAEPEIDLDALRGFKDQVVSKLTGGLATMAKARKVNVIQGEAKFKDANHLSIRSSAGEQTLAFDQAIIAAGSRVAVLPGMDIDDPRVIDSTGALALKEIPKTMLIVGGGIIGLEMATVYAALGSQVSIVEFMPQIMPGADKDLIAPLQKRLKKSIENIWLSTKVESMQAVENGIEVKFSAADGGKGPESQVFDYVLVATGRRPNGDQIDAAAAGVNVDERGFIAVDDQMRTNVGHIFAIGDIVGQPMLAHKATHEAKVAAEVCAGQKSAFLASVIPSVAYTDPEIAWVGLTETEAKAQSIEYEKGVFPWAASGRALGNDRTEGKTKLLFDPKTHRVLGGGIVGQNAGDLIAEVALAIEMGSDAADIGLTIHPHPTLSETVAMAAEVYEGTITDLYIPKKK